MPSQPFYGDRIAYFLCSINALSIFLTLLVYATSAMVKTFRKRDKTDVKPVSWTKLRKLQLGLSGTIFFLGVVHCILLARTVNFAVQSDPTLLCALFWTLSWLILLLGLIDGETDAGISLHRAWAVTLVFETAAFVLTIMGTKFRGRPIAALDLTVQAVRLTALVTLSVGTFLIKQHVFSSKSDATEEETRPLLDAEANDTAKNVDSKKANKDKNDDEDEEEEKADEDDGVDKKLLDELKSRPLKQYVSSFAIFLPHLQPRTKYQWTCVAIVCLCTVLTRVEQVLFPLSLGYLVNSLATAQRIPWLPVAAYLSLSMLSRAGIIDIVDNMATLRFKARVNISLSRFCYDHIMNLSADFHESENSNKLGRLIDRGSTVTEFFQNIIFKVVPQIADLFISIFVLAYLFGGYLCFVAATTIVLFTYASTKFVKQKSKLRRKWIDSMIAQWRHLWETHYSWTTVSHFNKIEYEQGEFGKKTETMTGTEIVVNTFDAVAQFIRQLIVSFGFVVATLIAVDRIVSGSMDVGSFVMLVTYWGQVMSPVTGLIRQINRTSEQLIDAERLLVILEQTPTVQDSPDAKEIDFQGGAVDFENVTFSYDGERIVSEDISFSIEAGQTVAIVGETGGGKSTLLKLLFRFYDPTKGRILIDGQDVRDLKVESFRDLIGYVPQDPALFQRSISENVKYPNMAATDDEIEAACKGAVLHDKITTFTKGYKQKIGQRGAKLSGGEQQRLAIARCILKKPKMLLLDEATSSVDSVTESKIHEGLKQLCKGRTTFIIAHRLSTILHADQILVMKNGKLVEAGPHRVLIKQNGSYKELWDAQLKLQSQDPDKVEQEDLLSDAVDGKEKEEEQVTEKKNGDEEKEPDDSDPKEKADNDEAAHTSGYEGAEGSGSSSRTVSVSPSRNE